MTNLTYPAERPFHLGPLASRQNVDCGAWDSDLGNSLVILPGRHVPWTLDLPGFPGLSLQKIKFSVSATLKQTKRNYLEYLIQLYEKPSSPFRRWFRQSSLEWRFQFAPQNHFEARTTALQFTIHARTPYIRPRRRRGDESHLSSRAPIPPRSFGVPPKCRLRRLGF